MVGDTLTRSRI